MVEVTKKDLDLLKYFVKKSKKSNEKKAMYIAFCKGLNRKLKEEENAT